ncbi:MAG: hypothetical protein DMD86_16135, partial [Candidatus Rokuibacteriota bacterium]
MNPFPVPPRRVTIIALLALLALLLAPFAVPPYQTVLLSYGLVFAIAALGFNLLLGYTGLLSFGHSAYFGIGAYAVAFIVKYLGIESMEVFILGGVLASAVVAALFGFLCVRYTRIFFGILTLALSQVLWSLTYKFFWYTGGSDGLRVPTPHLVGGAVRMARGAAEDMFGFLCVRYTRIFFGILTLALSQVLWSLTYKFFWYTGGSDGLRVPTPHLVGGAVRMARGAAEDKLGFLSHRYYYYVLVLFVLCVAVMWVIVHSPFGKALQAIRDNETRAEFVGVQVWRYRWVAFLISGGFTGLAGALWVPLNGLTTPDIMHWTFSGEIVFFTVLGGFQTFFGPVIGA